MHFYERFLHEHSTDPDLRFETGRAYHLIAIIHSAGQHVDQAKEAIGRSIEVWRNLIAESNDPLPYRKELANTHYLLGALCTSNMEPDAAHAAYQVVVEQLGLCLDHDADGKTANQLAWILVDCPDKSIRDPERSLRLAQAAVAAMPEQGNYWNTLGLAFYRTGDFAAAEKALEQSMALRDGGNGYDWFFLSMACWQLSEKVQARAWYEKAVRWFDQERTKEEDIYRHRAEAESLIGVQQPRK
jgi:tetratricopeptide (TPR) repeat protein